jgi:hypothetical protein
MRWTAVKNPAFVIALLLLTSAAAGMSAAVHYFKISLKKLPIYAPEGRLLMSLPTETASWVMVNEHREKAEVEKELGTSNYISRLYKLKAPKDGKDAFLQFHAAYYTGMIDTVPHVPDRCFVAGGMQIGTILGNLPMSLSRETWTLDEDAPEKDKGHIYKVRLDNTWSDRPGSKARLPRDAQDLRLRTMKFLADGKPLYAGYFFITNGVTESYADLVRLRAFDLRSTYAYYMKVQFTSSQVGSGEELVELSSGLLDELFGELMRCVPDWVEVEAGRYPHDNPLGQAGAAAGPVPTPSNHAAASRR